MDKKEMPYLIALHGVEGMGAQTIRRLIRSMGSPKEVWEASHDALAKTGQIQNKVILALEAYRRHFSWDRFSNVLAQKEIKYISYWDAEYPEILKESFSPPMILFYKGNLAFSERMIAFVGGRRYSAYGKRVAEDFAGTLSEKGVTIVSGGAKGIDSFSHRGALRGGTPTIAVLGCGLDVVYPPENRRLFDEICEKGMLISEFVPGAEPIAKHFPMRNRIISGLAQGVVVIEARARSGSLITADYALSDGRDVFAVPSSIYDPHSAGCHWLIRQGAQLLSDPRQILTSYNWIERTVEKNSSQSANSVITFNFEELNILDTLSYAEYMTVNQILEKTEIPLQRIQSYLLKMVLAGYVVQNKTGGYLRMKGR